MKKKVIAVFLSIVTALMLSACGGSSESGQDKPQSGHEHAYATELVEATCVSGGYTLHKCECGAEYRDSETDPLGHSFNDVKYNGESHWTECVRCHIDSQEGSEEHIMHPEGDGIKCDACGLEVAESDELVYTLTEDERGYTVSSTAYGSACLVIPETHEGKPVVGIEANAFSDSKAWIRNIVLPSSLEFIGERGMSNFRANRVFFRGNVAQWCGIDFARAQDNPVYHSLSGELWIGGEKITELTVPAEITTVKPYAFAGCESVEQAVFESGVTELQTSAFAYSGVKTITLPASLTVIAADAFDGCPLERIISDGDKYAVKSGCWIDTASKTLLRGFEGAVIPADGSVTSIAANAFQNSTIKEINIPDCVTEIGEGAFSKCTLLEKVTLGKGVKIIPKNAFEGCVSMRRFTVPDTVTTVSELAFSNCTRLVSVVIGRGVKAIEGKNNFISKTYAFQGCGQLYEVYNLSTLTIAAGDRDKNGAVAAYALDVYTDANTPSKCVTDADGVVFYNGDEKVYCLGYEGDGGRVVLPAKYDGKSYEIASGAFAKDGVIEELTVPNGVTAIGTNAFWSMFALKSVTIGEGAEEVGWNCFYECPLLESVRLPSTLKKVGRWAFKECVSLKSIEIPEGVTEIGSEAFNGCISLESIKLPTSLRTIEKCFYKCSSLKSVVLPDGLASIPNHLFNSCSSLESVTIGSGVKTIGERAFYKCVSLKSVDLKNAETVGKEAFAYCASLASATLTNVKTVGKQAFYECVALEEAKFGAVETVGDYAFMSCSSLRALEFGSSLSSIGSQAFCYCTSLASLKLGDSVSSIGQYAFYDSKLTYAVIPASVVTLGAYAFADTTVSPSCTHIYCEAESAPDTWAAGWDYIGENEAEESVYAAVHYGGTWSCENGTPKPNA